MECRLFPEQEASPAPSSGPRGLTAQSRAARTCRPFRRAQQELLDSLRLRKVLVSMKHCRIRTGT